MDMVGICRSGQRTDSCCGNIGSRRLGMRACICTVAFSHRTAWCLPRCIVCSLNVPLTHINFTFLLGYILFTLEFGGGAIPSHLVGICALVAK